MPSKQLDLFAAIPPPTPALHPDVVAGIRKRLREKLALVKAATEMPWKDQLAIIHEDNDFRSAKNLLPAAEGAALWAEFDVEMDRLYAIMNEGKEPDLLD